MQVSSVSRVYCVLNVRCVCDIQKADHVSDTEDEAEDEIADSKGTDYNYILCMTLWTLTNEKRDALLKQRDEKAEQLRILRLKTHKDLWTEDLDKLVAELDVRNSVDFLQSAVIIIF